MLALEEINFSTLYIILAAFPGARQLTFVEERNESWIQLTIPPTLPYFINGETIAQRDQVAHHYTHDSLVQNRGKELRTSDLKPEFLFWQLSFQESDQILEQIWIPMAPWTPLVQQAYSEEV